MNNDELKTMIAGGGSPPVAAGAWVYHQATDISATDLNVTGLPKKDGVIIDGICIECAQGKYRFTLHPTVFEKYAGTLREIITESPCVCGGYVWLISIPPKCSMLDDE